MILEVFSSGVIVFLWCYCCVLNDFSQDVVPFFGENILILILQECLFVGSVQNAKLDQMKKTT